LIIANRPSTVGSGNRESALVSPPSGREISGPVPGPSIPDLLRARAARGSLAPHDDGARIALAVEGGGMRGVVSAGMVAGLEALGLTAAFDAVFGSSAGALNGAYFLAGQAAFGATIYSEDINNRAFIDLQRPLRGRPIVDLDYLIHDVAGRRKKLRTERVLASHTPLHVLATDVDTAQAVALNGFVDGPALLDALRAGAQMPVIAGDPIAYAGRRYLDASLTEPIPVASAEAAGFTHILALLTRPDETDRRLSWFDRLYVLPRLRAVSSELAERYQHRFGRYRATLDALSAGRGPAGRAVTVTVRPTGPPISKLERRAAVLTAGAESGRQAVLALFHARS
jgi:predicted patatin/cPLA2 family phospholipase